MCKAGGGEILSNIELVLPWNVVKTCYHLEPDGQSCFLALNGEENTSSQITVKKQPDDSVKITVTVMSLQQEEEQEKEDEEAVYADEQQPSTSKRSSRSSVKKEVTSPKASGRQTRSSGKSPSGNIFEKMGEDRAVGPSKIAKLRQQGKSSPATEAAQKLIHSLRRDEAKSRKQPLSKREWKKPFLSGAKPANMNKRLTAIWGGRKRRRQSAPSNIKYEKDGRNESEEEEDSEEESEEEESEEEEEPKQNRQRQGMDQDTIQEVIDYMVEQEQERNPKAVVIAPNDGYEEGNQDQPNDADLIEVAVQPGRKRGKQKPKRPIYMPDPDVEDRQLAELEKFLQGDQNQPPEDQYEDDEEEPQIQIEQLGGSTIIIVKPPEEEREKVEVKGRRGRGRGKNNPRQPLKKRWSAMHANESQESVYFEGGEPQMFRDPYDLDLADDGIGIQKHIITPSKRRRTTAFPGTPKKRVPRDGDIECKYCEASVKDYSYLYRHVRKMHSDEVDMQDYLDDLRPLMKTPCPVCDKVFSSTGNVYTHIKQCHSETIVAGHECPECQSEFKTRGSLTQHIRNVHSSKKLECDQCDKTFTDQRALREHINTAHETTETFQCDVCHKYYMSKCKLRRHRLIHGAFRHFCPYCNKGFHLKDNMNKHIRIVHESAESPQHRCPHCNKNFLVKGNLTQHIRGVHLKQFAFNCTNCNTGFHRIKSLQQHMEVCTGENPAGEFVEGGFEQGEVAQHDVVQQEEDEDEAEEAEEEVGAPMQEVTIMQEGIEVQVEGQVMPPPEDGAEVTAELSQEQALRIMEMAVEQQE